MGQYLILDGEDKFPVLIADSLEKVLAMLDEYTGFGTDPTTKYLGFTEFDDCGYPSSYEGCYTYEININGKTLKDTFLRYYVHLNDFVN
jgi:hypothetical protein